jgi:uncharacterized membrane protein YeaQ/YmgE (transglycosylase-associated protein family)
MDSYAVLVVAVLSAILGVVAAALSPRIFKKPPPFGTTAEYVICVVVAVAIGLIDFLWALPAFGMDGLLKLVGSLAEGFFAALLVLWILRQVKRTAPST